VLVTADESRHTRDAGDIYIVLPEHPWWQGHPRWLQGKPLDDGYVYSSDRNDRWLSTQELAALLP
jgi:UDP-N-acetylglucosamine 4,6-dehydratase